MPDGARTATIRIAVLDDAVDEPDETLTLTLTENGSAAGSATLTIADDDLPVVKLAAPEAVADGGYLFESETAGDDDAKKWALTRVSDVPDADLGALTVNLRVAESGAGDFVAAEDETAATASFAAGEASAAYTPVMDDTVDEGHGRVTVTLLAGEGYALPEAAADFGGDAAVRDDDGTLVEFAFDRARIEVAEGQSAAVQVEARTVGDGTFTVTDDLGRVFAGESSFGPVTVQTTAGTATGGGTDYADLDQALTFPFADFAAADGALALALAPAAVATTLDSTVDPDETFEIGFDNLQATARTAPGTPATVEVVVREGAALVSNTGQTAAGTTSDSGLGAVDVAQAFTTGGNREGYLLSAVRVRFDGASPSAAVPTATLVRGSPAGDVSVVLTGPSALGTDSEYAFRAAAGTRLRHDTTYWLVVEGSGSLKVAKTASAAEDGASMPDWAIADSRAERAAGSAGAFAAQPGEVAMIAVEGVAGVRDIVHPRVLLDSALTVADLGSDAYGYSSAGGTLADDTFAFEGDEYTVDALGLVEDTNDNTHSFDTLTVTDGSSAALDGEAAVGFELASAAGTVMFRFGDRGANAATIGEALAGWTSDAGTKRAIRVLDLNALDLWSADLDYGDDIGSGATALAGVGTGAAGSGGGSLTATTFVLDGATYTVDRLAVLGASSGQLLFGTTPDLPADALALALPNGPTDALTRYYPVDAAAAARGATAAAAHASHADVDAAWTFEGPAPADLGDLTEAVPVYLTRTPGRTPDAEEVWSSTATPGRAGRVAAYRRPNVAIPDLADGLGGLGGLDPDVPARVDGVDYAVRALGYRALGDGVGDEAAFPFAWLVTEPALPRSQPLWLELAGEEGTNAYPLSGAAFGADGFKWPELTRSHGWEVRAPEETAQAVYMPRAVRLLVEKPDAAITLRVSAHRIREGDSDADEGEATITAVVDPPQPEAFTLAVTASSDDAARWEFAGSNRTLAFAVDAAESTGSVRIRAVHNDADDGDATIMLTATPMPRGRLPTAQAVLVVADDEVPQVSVTSPCAAPACDHLFEAEAALAATGAFTLARDGSTAAALDVVVRVAESGGDFVPAAGEGVRTATIAAGQSSVELTPVVANGIDGGHGTVTVELVDTPTNAYDAAPGEGTATAAVRDDDGTLLTLTVDPAALSVREGLEAELDAKVATAADGTFTEAGDLDRVFGAASLSVKAATTDGTATAGTDYTALDTTVAVAFAGATAVGAGSARGLELTAALPGIATVDNGIDDAGKDFVVVLSLPVGTDSRATTGTPASATVTLVEGPVVTLAVADAMLTEGETTAVTATASPTHDAAFTVRLSAPTSSRYRFVGDARARVRCEPGRAEGCGDARGGGQR